MKGIEDEKQGNRVGASSDCRFFIPFSASDEPPRFRNGKEKL